jgi:uncharacterized phiE125 gp8 family phage protein
MQIKEKSGAITDPVSVAEVKLYIGYTSTDQDALFAILITAAREWLEDHCAFSCVSKSYIARFEKSDLIDGWLELPMVPVTSITSVQIDAADVDYEEKGDEKRYIYPDELIYTGVAPYEIVVEFIAGASNSRAKTSIMRIVSDMFNNKDDDPKNVNVAKLSYDTLRYVEGLNQNTGI